MNLKTLAGMFLAAVSTAATANAAAVTFDFGTSSNASVGSNHVAVTVGAYTVTAYGFDANGAAHNLYHKNTGGEKGLGLTSTDDNELTLNSSGLAPANFIQLDISQINHLATGGMIEADSVTQTEKFDIFASNTLGVEGANLLISASPTQGSFIGLPNWGSYKYVSMSVHPDAQQHDDNVLFRAISVTPVSVPLPAAVWSSLSGLGMLAATMMAKRLRNVRIA